jgi:hypothetical protein
MISYTPEEILELAKSIVTAKTNLATLQARWDAFISASSGTRGKSYPPRKGGRKPNSKSVTGRVLAHVNANYDLSFNAGELSEVLKISKKQAETTLFKLNAAKKINKHSRGRYEANRKLFHD